MPSIFTRIIEGAIPGTLVGRDDLCVAFRTISPLRPGHTLVIPIEEIDHRIDLPSKLRGHLIEVCAEIGAAIQESFSPTRVGLMIAGLAHIHLVPIDDAHDVDFANADSSATREVIEAAAGRIRDVLEKRGASGVSK